jgi:hypothetical protein
MGTPIRSSDEISRLYKQLADRISDNNEEEVRRVYKELLRSGVPLAEIVGMAMSSVHKMENRRENGGSEWAINEFPKTKRVPVERRQSASEVTLQRTPGVDTYVDRSERKRLRGADGDDGPLKELSVRRAQTESTRVTSEAEEPEPVAVGGAAILDIHHEPTTDTADDPQLISPVGLAQSPRPGSGLQLVARLAMRRAADDPRLTTPAGVAQSLSLGSGLQSIGRLATRTIIVLTAALVAIVGISLLLRGHRPADEHRVAALHPAVVSPPTLVIAAGAAGLFGALSPTRVASAGLSEEKRPMIIMPGAASTEKAAVIAATPAIVPTEAPVSPADVSALLQHGDALLATGDIASARLFYEKAAMAGDAMAALRLGETYDSLFLTRAGLTGVHGDRAVAARWYRRASELGASEADVLLKSTEDGQD